MGSTRYDDAIYDARVSDVKSRGADYFAHSSAISSGATAAAVHESLDPKKPNKAGVIIRESLDTPTNPASRAIAVGFDVTGSMSVVPRTFVTKLKTLMSGIVKKNIIPDPHVLFAAIGDATSDKAPLQVGQFEGGNEVDEALANIYLEGNGGGHNTESYELLMYFMARKTTMDCVNKRGEKGYLFLSGDELPYPEVKRTEVDAIIGDRLQENIPTEKILEELREKFEVFWLFPKGTTHWGDPHVMEPLQKMFGQHLIKLEEPEDVCEVIISTIAANEGFDLRDVAAGLKDLGSDAASIDRATRAVVPFSKTVAVGRTAAATSGSLMETGTDAGSKL